MDWKKERDLLIEQTLAFVQSVAGKKLDGEPIPDAERRVEAAAIEARDIIERPIVEPTEDMPVSTQIPQMIATSDFRAEVQTRIVSFRAHQERFDREREEYFTATLAKARAAIRNDTALSPSRPVNR
jgi:hypothetical protein